MQPHPQPLSKGRGGVKCSAGDRGGIDIGASRSHANRVRAFVYLAFHSPLLGRGARG